MTTRAGIYVRISDDRAGRGLGVARQEKDCCAFAEREGWEVAKVYSDNDLSAYNGKERPAYRTLLRDLDAGRIDAVIAWHPDRLHRSVRELEDFIDAVDAAGAAVRTVTAGVVDLSTASGRMTARVGAAVARHESEHKAERIRRKMRELAEAGHGIGGPRMFGYETDHRTVREDEAALVREAACRALAGESLRAIARDWTERGVPTVRGAKGWSYQAMRRMLLSPRHAGLRTHHPRPQGCGDAACTGNPCLTVVGQGDWPAILDRETHDRLRDRLKPGRAPANRVRNRLLTGLVHCGRCCARMYAKNRSDGRRVYSCVRDPGRGFGTACGAVSVVSEPVDDLVGKAVLAVLAGPGLDQALRTLAGDDEERRRISERLAADTARLETLAVDYAEGELTREEWKAARERLVVRISEARDRLSYDDASGVLASLPASEGALRAGWAAADITWRRAVVDAVIERVDVAPKGKQGGNTFDPNRVAIRWRG